MTVDRDALFIGGGWVAPSTSSRITVLNAATRMSSAPFQKPTWRMWMGLWRQRETLWRTPLVAGVSGGSCCSDDPVRGRIAKALRRISANCEPGKWDADRAERGV
jgi:hypothetical protein